MGPVCGDNEDLILPILIFAGILGVSAVNLVLRAHGIALFG
jgi:hypothetical protein